MKIIHARKPNTKTLLTVKTDKVLKREAQEMAEKIGVPLSTIINASLRQFVREKKITFEVGYTPNKKTIQAIVQGEKDFKAGKLGKPTADIKELEKRLNS